VTERAWLEWEGCQGSRALLWPMGFRPDRWQLGPVPSGVGHTVLGAAPFILFQLVQVFNKLIQLLQI
jgi:hypothetical protein